MNEDLRIGALQSNFDYYYAQAQQSVACMGLSDCIFEPSDQDYDYVDSWFDFE